MTNLTDALHIPDTQSSRDDRQLAIQRVGVKDVRYPLTIQVAGAAQATAAMWDLDVALARRGQGHAHVTLRRLARRTRRAARCGGACVRIWRACSSNSAPQEGRIEARFSFFLRKRAPVSGVQSLLDYQGRWIAETRAGAHYACGAKSACR